MHPLISAARGLLLMLAVVASTALAHAAGGGDRKVALVIGNSEYGLVPRLPNPVDDATAVARQLEAIEFEVTLLTDLDGTGMRKALQDFEEKVTGASIAIVYYAGHGIEVGGTNYLIPVDAALKRDTHVRDEAISLDRVLEAVAGASKLRLVLLDACRNNPFVASMARTVATRAVPRGLVRVEPSLSTLVSYAAEEGTTADDGNGEHSPYTTALLKHIATPGLEVNYIFRHVKADVEEMTDGAQVPAYYGSLGKEEIYLTPPPPPAPVGPAAEADPEVVFWESMKESAAAADYIAYLRKFPGGTFQTLAKTRLAALEPQQVAPPSEPVDCPEGLIASVGEVILARASDRCLKPGEAFKDCTECPQMVVVPAGSFTMGSPKSDKLRSDDEGPTHEVRIGKPLAFGTFEVTRAEFAAFIEDTGYAIGNECVTNEGGQWHSTPDRSWKNVGYPQEDDHPAACVNWDDAAAYANWLSRITGHTYRLPTEAEWEYAARGASEPQKYRPFAFGSKLSGICDYANAADLSTSVEWRNDQCSDGVGLVTSSVGAYKPNEFGLHDMMGNLWEWTEDCYQESYSGVPDNGDAWTGGDCIKRVSRGGSWGAQAPDVRSAERFARHANYRGIESGFRVVRVLAD